MVLNQNGKLIGGRYNLENRNIFPSQSLYPSHDLWGLNHIENISNPNGKPKFYFLVSYVCKTDNSASDRRINEINKNDILIFYNASAYCFVMASNYNSCYWPPEVLRYNKQTRLVRKRETLEDFLTNKLVLKI